MGTYNHVELRRLFNGTAVTFGWTLRVGLRERHHSASRTRIMAGLSGFFHLDPVPRWPRPVGCTQSLRHDALKAHFAGLLEDRDVIRGGVRANLPGARRPRQSRAGRAVRATWGNKWATNVTRCSRALVDKLGPFEINPPDVGFSHSLHWESRYDLWDGPMTFLTTMAAMPASTALAIGDVRMSVMGLDPDACC
jgi:hypothetical protein